MLKPCVAAGTSTPLNIVIDIGQAVESSVYINGTSTLDSSSLPSKIPKTLHGYSVMNCITLPYTELIYPLCNLIYIKTFEDLEKNDKTHSQHQKCVQALLFVVRTAYILLNTKD